MKDARMSRTKGRLRDIDSNVWDRKDDLKKGYEYLLRLPISKNPEDHLSTVEKQAYISGTPKSRRNQEFNTLFNAKGELRQRLDYIQPWRERSTLIESHLYRPEQVLPSPAMYMKHLALVTAAQTTASNMGVQRLYSARQAVANEKREVIQRQRRLEEIQEDIRREHSKVYRELPGANWRVKQLEGDAKIRDSIIESLRARLQETAS